MLFKSTFVAAILASIAVFSVAEAHVSLKSPCPRGSTFCEPEQFKDYDSNSPVGTYDTMAIQPVNGICKHKASGALKPQNIQAGSNLATQYAIGAAHGGGHCQWALSYDQGKTWVVFQTMLTKCLANVSGSSTTINVKIPATAPSGQAIFAWLWNNKIGNREFYTSCADVNIQGSTSRKFSGVEPFIANFGEQAADTKAKNGQLHFLPEGDSMSAAVQLKKYSLRKKITITVPKKK
ncbi:hypothetical protein BGX31_009461 [Mortierella sp. GBA43]|nr:hypothetical protein BGX31_009461 [Mortierella sp. GBA43]